MAGLIARWHCLEDDCDAAGTSDREAEAHVKAESHSTVSHQIPATPERNVR